MPRDIQQTIRLTVELTADDLARLERYDRAVYEMGLRLLAPEHAKLLAQRPFKHDSRATLEALLFGALIDLEKTIATTESKGREAPAAPVTAAEPQE